jgi:ABC-type multidrug transport system fused ATPase/permease subunit
VPQEGFVMSASLRENIMFRYDATSAHDNEIEKSLAVAQFHLREEHLPDGLETEIGERGVNLSGGQRQRVSLARARFFDRPVILLDDCLSAVDVDTESQLIGELIDGEWKQRTRVLVTHRLSVLARVDRVFFMEDGRIVDSGLFSELLARNEKVRAFAASVERAEDAAVRIVEGSGGAETESVS